MSLAGQVKYLKDFLAGKNNGEQVSKFSTINYPAIDLAREYNVKLHQAQARARIWK
jgi:hypothetical protein